MTIYKEFVGAQSSVLVVGPVQFLTKGPKTPSLSNKFELKADG
jgi:hypothetical protein